MGTHLQHVDPVEDEPLVSVIDVGYPQVEILNVPEADVADVLDPVVNHEGPDRVLNNLHFWLIP